MRVALLTPTFWPEVRRGTERTVHDLAVELADRGHDVTILTSHRAATSEAVEEGVRVIRAWRPPEVPPLNWYEHHAANAPGIVWRLLRGGFDIAHAFFPVEAWAATHARRAGGPPVVFSFHGIPNRLYLVGRRYRLEWIASATARAERVTVLSRAAASEFERYFGSRPLVLPAGVRRADFDLGPPRRDPRPTFICAASLGDPRKGAAVLFDAFSLVRRTRPDARLVLVSGRDPVMSADTPSLPDGADLLVVDRTEELAALYGRAWGSVLAATGEAFGCVLVESLAAGTPVAVADSGAVPEIIRTDSVGRLFPPGDVQACAAAMLDVLELGTREETADACKEEAARHDWSRVAEQYMRVYEEVLAAGDG